MSQSVKIPPDFSPQSVADILGVGRQAVYDLIDTGRLDSYKIGRLRRIKRASLLKFMGREESQ